MACIRSHFLDPVIVSRVFDVPMKNLVLCLRLRSSLEALNQTLMDQGYSPLVH